MRINPFVYGFLVLVIFFGAIGGAKAAGVWSVSGKLTSTGEKVLPTGTNPDEVKGWMTLADVSKAYGVPEAEILAAFELPADTPATTQIKDLETDTFSTTNLRTWLKERLGQQ
jgi:hypothetical protein